MIDNAVLDEVKKLKAIADVGLLYSKDSYDRDRYTELQEIAYKLMSHLSSSDVKTLRADFPPAVDYPTAKVDVRALILSNNKEILLVRESADGKWSLPGGWADIGYSAKETVVKECKEETGLDVSVKALLAVFDKRFYPHPPQSSYVYKMVFYCVPTSFQLEKGFDVLDVQYFPINNLPDLSKDRILKEQIELVYKKVLSNDLQAFFN